MLDISRLHELFKPIFAGTIGLQLSDASETTVSGSIKVKKSLCTGRDDLHWGVMVGMAQTLGSVGAVLNLPEGARTRTVSTHTEFHAEPPLDCVVEGICEREEITPARMTWKTRIQSPEGELYAEVVQVQDVIESE